MMMRIVRLCSRPTQPPSPRKTSEGEGEKKGTHYISASAEASAEVSAAPSA